LARKFFPGISFPPLFSLAQHLRSVSCNLVLLRITLLRLSIRFQGEIPPAAARHVNKMNWAAERLFAPHAFTFFFPHSFFLSGISLLADSCLALWHYLFRRGLQLCVSLSRESALSYLKINSNVRRLLLRAGAVASQENITWHLMKWNFDVHAPAKGVKRLKIYWGAAEAVNMHGPTKLGSAPNR
jgi:hypothetical protein